jgi:lysophospholipase L1-like esterase
MEIAFLGDSLTEGWPGAAYLPLLCGRLPQHQMLNLGRAGDTVADVLRRVTRRGLDPVDLAFIWAGVNDAVIGAWDATDARPGDGGGWAERLARICADYEALLGWTAARTAGVVCVRPLVLEADGSLWQRRADGLGDAIDRLVGARIGARSLDLRPAFAAAEAAGGAPFTTDGVHFTDAGAEVVAAAFAAVVDEVARGDPAASAEGG